MRYFLLFWLPIFTFGQDFVVLPKEVEKKEICEIIYTIKDLADSIHITEILKTEPRLWQKSVVDIPNFGWGKRSAWLKFDVKASAENQFLLQINSSVFDDLSFYLVQNKRIIQAYEHLSRTSSVDARPYYHRDFVFPLKLTTGQHYTIYLHGKSILNTNKFPLIIWTQKSFEQNDRKVNLFWGIIIGVFTLIAIINFTIGLLLNLRIFHFYGFYVLGIIMVFFHLEGYLYEYLPINLIKNSFFDLSHLFTYSFLFWNILFVMAFTKVSLANRPIFERSLRVLAFFFCISLLFAVFSPLWLPFVSDTFLQVYGWFGRGFLIFSILMLFVNVFMSVRQNYLSMIYLIAVVPAILLYLISQYFNHIFNFWLVQPYVYLLGFLIELVILSVAMFFKVKNYLFKTVTVEPVVNNIENEPVIKENTIKKEILSKREIEIITAFAKGFTYQDISDAMFISPHTVRTHIKNIYQKLDINSKAEAVKIAIEQGWL